MDTQTSTKQTHATIAQTEMIISRIVDFSLRRYVFRRYCLNANVGKLTFYRAKEARASLKLIASNQSHRMEPHPVVQNHWSLVVQLAYQVVVCWAKTSTQLVVVICIWRLSTWHRTSY